MYSEEGKIIGILELFLYKMSFKMLMVDVVRKKLGYSNWLSPGKTT